MAVCKVREVLKETTNDIIWSTVQDMVHTWKSFTLSISAILDDS